jgi:DHA2 family multidrug resistance protein-like MFS transporter
MDDVTTAGRREWIALAVLALPTLLVTMDLSVLFLAVPKLTQDLRPTSSELLWITDIYGVLLAASLITMGTLGDRIGRRRLLLIGGGAFAGSSALAAFSTSAGLLIGARALLGVAAATLAPSSLGLIRNMFNDPVQRQFAIGAWLSCFAAGAALGPVVGGVLLQHFWWGSVFLMNVPVMALLLALGPALLPQSRDPNPGRVDLTSVALSLASLGAVTYSIIGLSEHGIDATAALTMAGGLLLGAAFLRRQQSLTYPLVDLRLFRSLIFAIACGALFVSVFVVSGTELFIAQFLQLVHGLTPFLAGLWLLPGVISLIIGSVVAPYITRRVPPGAAVAVSLVVATGGLIILAHLHVSSDLTLVVAGTALIGLGAGTVGTLGTDIVVAAAPPGRAGAASALSETATELGGAIGIAILGSIGTAIYRNDISTTVPSGVPSASVHGARASLGTAVDAAGHLTAQTGDTLLHAARLAFTHGLNAAALAGAATCIVMASLAGLQLRRARANA